VLSAISVSLVGKHLIKLFDLMRKTAKFIYLLIGTLFPILIGGLHTMVHFSDLNTVEVKAFLDNTLPIMGSPQTYWHTWGMMSFMMGIAFIVIGLLNFSILRQMGKDAFPPIFPLLAMLLYLLCVVYAGHQFEQAPQFYGGLFGLLLTLICLVLSLRK